MGKKEKFNRDTRLRTGICDVLQGQAIAVVKIFDCSILPQPVTLSKNKLGTNAYLEKVLRYCWIFQHAILIIQHFIFHKKLAFI